MRLIINCEKLKTQKEVKNPKFIPRMGDSVNVDCNYYTPIVVKVLHDYGDEEIVYITAD